MDKLPDLDRWSHLYGARRRVIACATVIEEMRSFLPPDVPYEVLDFGLHLKPQNLKVVLQEKINEASQDADVVILGYGLCSMAVVGLKATTATLVVARSDDCIAIFLGSCAAYKQQASTEPGTYYLTKGWIEAGDSPFSEYEKLAAKYGEVKAMRMMKLMLKNYTRLAFINTGNYELDRYRDYARQSSAKFDLRYEEIDGSSALVQKLIAGPWDDEFVVVSPGEAITYDMFAR
ncbi:MAG: DUF1638 domain-containing protein [Thermoflexales bacterium]|nr:DUF1638 domain-containing protein [Thermoflexales bacterium]